MVQNLIKNWVGTDTGTGRGAIKPIGGIGEIREIGIGNGLGGNGWDRTGFGGTPKKLNT